MLWRRKNNKSIVVPSEAGFFIYVEVFHRLEACTAATTTATTICDIYVAW